jgi:hypothetical protein
VKPRGGKGKRSIDQWMKEAHVLTQQVTVRRTERIRRLAKQQLEERSNDSSDSEGEPGQLTRFQSTLGIKLRATDPRYINHADDYNRGDVVIPVSQVRKFLCLKMELSEEVAKVWLTTADMGFSLTDEDHMVVCPKDLRNTRMGASQASSRRRGNRRLDG